MLNIDTAAAEIIATITADTDGEQLAELVFDTAYAGIADEVKGGQVTRKGFHLAVSRASLRIGVKVQAHLDTTNKALAEAFNAAR